MSQSPETPPPAPKAGFDFMAWWQRTGLSGKLLACGGLAGVIFAFLPAWSASGSGPISMSYSLSVVQFWPGMVGLVGFAGCIVLAFLLYQPQPSAQHRQLLYGVLGCAGVVVLMTLWLFISLMGRGTSVSTEYASASVGMGFGMYLTLLAAIAVGAGAGLKAKEEKLF